MKFLCLILISIGTLISGYLLLRHFELADLSMQSSTDFCSALFGAGCDDALRSPIAVQLGLPLAGWGLVYYGTLVSLLLLGWILGDTFWHDAVTAALITAFFAALGSALLFITMVSGLSPFCPLCAIVHTINFLLLWPLKGMTGRTLGQVNRTIASVFRYLTGYKGYKAADPVMARWKSVGFLTSGLVAVAIYQWVFVEYTLRIHAYETPFDLHQTISMFKSTEQLEIPITESDAQLGSPNAPVRMVVFNDFCCPACRRLAETIHSLADKFQDKLQIVFKHFPLDSTCNALVNREVHPGACDAATAAEAARVKGKFWYFHESIFKPHYEGKIALDSLAAELNIDRDWFDNYRHSDEAMSRVKADIELGIKLGIDGTPTVFINGRRVCDIRPESLFALVAYEYEETAIEAKPHPN